MELKSKPHDKHSLSCPFWGLVGARGERGAFGTGSWARAWDIHTGKDL